MIKKLYPQPEFKKKHSYYKCEVCFYLKDRIEALEKSDEFKTLKEKSISRKLSGQKAAKTQADKLLKLLDSLDITIDRIKKKALIKLACEAF